MSPRRSGSHPPGPSPRFPDDCVQSLIDEWWTVAENREVRRGQLLWAHAPFFDYLPYDLVPEARSATTEHERALFYLEQRRLSQRRAGPRLPVAALPQNPGETYSVYRAKFRPVLVLGTGGVEVDPTLTQRAARWQSVRTYLVAPYFGVDRTSQRGGWNLEFVRRIRHCEYPQYFWDMLPLGASASESVLRLDQIQPIGQNHEAFEYTPHRLSNEGLEVLGEWVDWNFSEDLDPGSMLHIAREEFSALSQT